MITIELGGTSALVTGGSNGIGAACVTALQSAGAFVVSLDISQPEDSAPDVAVVGDVRDPDARASALGQLRGTSSTLINNAALQLERRLPETSDEDLGRLLSINVVAAVQMAKEFAGLPGAESIVNVASVLGVSGDPALAGYSITKGAMVNFTRTAALEYAGRIRVNAVLPGAIRTPLTTRAWADSPDPAESERRMTAIYPAGRIGEPADVAGVVAFLASPLASFMTGALIAVDGGLLAANAEWGLERL